MTINCNVCSVLTAHLEGFVSHSAYALQRAEALLELFSVSKLLRKTATCGLSTRSYMLQSANATSVHASQELGAGRLVSKGTG